MLPNDVKSVFQLPEHHIFLLCEDHRLLVKVLPLRILLLCGLYNVTVLLLCLFFYDGGLVELGLPDGGTPLELLGLRLFLAQLRLRLLLLAFKLLQIFLKLVDPSLQLFNLVFLTIQSNCKVFYALCQVFTLGGHVLQI